VLAAFANSSSAPESAPRSGSGNGTSTPRRQAGRALMAVIQRPRCARPSVPTPDHLWVRTQAQFAMSAIEALFARSFD